MGHPKAVATGVALLLAALAGIGCAGMFWSLEKAFRKPGERLTTFPEKVSAEYDCPNKDLPFFSIEENELIPRRMKPGGEFNHRLVYVMCPDRPSAVITGRLETRIHFRGEAIVRETITAYHLKPGRWVVDAFIQLPPEAEAGIYSFELDFSSRPVKFAKVLNFVVEASDD